MTTYNTGNPLGSAAAKDLFDNAQNLDFAVNDITKAIWTDRFGKVRKTWYGIESVAMDAIRAFGYITMDSFEDGATLTLPNQVLRWKDNGEYYRWDGDFPKSVPAESTPDSTGGISLGSWVAIGDAALRSQLSDPDSPSKYPELHIARWRDEGDVRGWGAVGDGITDCTSSFMQAITYSGFAYVPPGTFVVDSSSISIGILRGEGDILTTAGMRISVPVFRNRKTMIQAKLMVPNFGFDNGTVDTSMWSGSRNALQGIAVLEVNGVEKIFMTQRVAGGSWTSATRCRIIEMELKKDGATFDITTYSDELNIGHGVDLSARLEGGNVYLYSSQISDGDYQNESAGKGYSRILWKGSQTAQTDIESFVVWGLSGSGHQFEKYNRATVKLSDDGKWLIMASAAINSGAVKSIFIYDFAELQSAYDKTLVKPAFITQCSAPSTQSGNVLQGVMSDGRSLTISYGGTAILSPNIITDMGFDGVETLFQEHEAGLDQYGVDGILNNSLYGFPWRFEPEGICSYRGGRLVSITEGWYATASVVTWMGHNWACIAAADTTGVPPSNGTYWVRTTKDATAGSWNSTTNYYTSKNFSHEVKSIYYIGPSLGLAQETALVTGINNRDDPSQVATGQGSGATSIGFQWRNSLTIRGWAAALNQYFDALTYDTSSRWRIYDQQVNNDNSVYASIQALFSSTFRGMILRGQGTTAANSAFLRLHSSDDPTYPSSLIEGTRSDGNFSRETDKNGSTRLSSVSGNIPLTLLRPDDGQLMSFEKVKGTNLGGVYRTTTSPEGNLTAPYGSLCIYISGTTATLYFKQTGTGNTGWVAK